MYLFIQKWDQKSFNMYFAIIFGNHISAFILPFAYYPSIITCSLAWVHCGLFMGILVNTICVDEKDAGKGGRTITNRILWISKNWSIQLCVLTI